MFEHTSSEEEEIKIRGMHGTWGYISFLYIEN
jgi:hypothetical protein